jgi:hypothetical protein
MARRVAAFPRIHFPFAFSPVEDQSAFRRRVSNRDQVNRVAALAMKRGKSVDFTGYWQRSHASLTSPKFN